jgi:hypothetical protein
MSRPQPPRPAKLVIGLFMADPSLLAEAAPILEDRFGPSDAVSPWMAFDYTTYYQPEMGRNLFRRMISFRDHILQADLPRIKCFTNEVETRFSTDGRRAVNIDPGYLLLERFVLATGKNFTHRIYLSDGIYADLTLLYQKGAFRTLPWTYPDYADDKMLRFLSLVRRRYCFDLNRSGVSP